MTKNEENFVHKFYITYFFAISNFFLIMFIIYRLIIRAYDQAYIYVHRSRYLCRVIAKLELAFCTMKQDRL